MQDIQVGHHDDPLRLPSPHRHRIGMLHIRIHEFRYGTPFICFAWRGHLQGQGGERQHLYCKVQVMNRLYGPADIPCMYIVPLKDHSLGPAGPFSRQLLDDRTTILKPVLPQLPFSMASPALLAMADSRIHTKFSSMGQ